MDAMTKRQTIKRIPYGKYLADKVGVIALLFILSVLLAACVAATLYLWKIIYDNLFMTPNQTDFIGIVIAFVSFTFVSTILKVFYDYVMAELGHSLFILIRNDFVHGVMRYPYNFFLENKSTDFVMRASDDCRLVSNGLTGAISGVLNGVQILFWIVFFLFLLPLASAVYCALAALMFLWVLLWRKKFELTIDQIVKSNNRVWRILVSIFYGIKAIKLDLLQGKIRTEADKLFSDYSASLNKEQKLSTIIWSIIMILPWIATGSFIILLARKIGTGEVAIGLFVLCLFFTDRILTPLIEMIQNLITLQSFKEADLRIKEYSKQQPESEGKKDIVEITHGIEFKNVDFSYPSSNFHLKNINLRVPVGKNVAIFGSSGSGKSTIAALLIRLFEPNSGEILLDNIPLREFGIECLRKKIILIPQDIQIYLGTIRENIDVKNALSDKEINMLIDRVQLRSFINGLPQGLDTKITLDGLDLSGGERQRIGIARALSLKGEIFIFDEITASLDKTTESEVVKMLFHGDHQWTTVTITHNPEILRYMDCVYNIDGGTVKER